MRWTARWLGEGGRASEEELLVNLQEISSEMSGVFLLKERRTVNICMTLPVKVGVNKHLEHKGKW